MEIRLHWADCGTAATAHLMNDQGAEVRIYPVANVDDFIQAYLLTKHVPLYDHVTGRSFFPGSVSTSKLIELIDTLEKAVAVAKDPGIAMA